MRPPLIGISTYAEDANGKFPLPREYVDSVRRAGGIPYLVTPGETRIAQTLELLDGFVLAGGGDIDPGRYNGAKHETIYELNEERDETEFALAETLLETGLPTLAICRGIQVINVVLGGTLIEHVPDEVGEDILHRAPPREPTPHAIRVDAESHIAGILGAVEFDAASWHHQAVRRVAPGLVTVAHAPDGTVEALEMPTHPWLFAVQWHPELTAATDPVQQRLFDELCRQALKHRSSHET